MAHPIVQTMNGLCWWNIHLATFSQVKRSSIDPASLWNSYTGLSIGYIIDKN